MTPDGHGGWRVEIHDQEPVEWETGDEIFRHQLTFQEMEALWQEARTINLSVRDAVHEVMKRLMRLSSPLLAVMSNCPLR